MRRRRRRSAVTVLTLALGCSIALLSQGKPSPRGRLSAEEKAAVVEIARKLQQSPLDMGLQSEGRDWLQTLVHAPDIEASVCDDEAPWVHSDYEYSFQLMAIYTLSNAAFVISNSDNGDMRNAHLAGLEGVIKAYQAIVAQDPAARWKRMEDLISKRDKGDLRKKLAQYCATPIPLKAYAMVTSAPRSPGPERFTSGWLKGFTQSPTEHVINQLDKSLTVRTVKGLVLDPSGAQMDGVIVEIQDANGRLWRTQTSAKGTFKIGGVPYGSYRFKVTKNGYKSVVGEIVVSNKANKAEQIKIVMDVGA